MGDVTAPIEIVAIDAHRPDLVEMFRGVVERGEGYPQQPPLQMAEYDAMWGKAAVVVGAIVDGVLAGAYYLKPNGPGLGAHIANAGYVVAPAHRGSGVGQRLVEDSIERAPGLGFDAIQFNFVFEDNPARGLYESFGWEVVGRIPQALPDGRAALVYWRAV